MNGLLGLLHVPLESGTTVRFSGSEEQPIPTPLKATAALSGVLGAIGVSAVVFGLFRGLSNPTWSHKKTMNGVLNDVYRLA